MSWKRICFQGRKWHFMIFLHHFDKSICQKINQQYFGYKNYHREIFYWFEISSQKLLDYSLKLFSHACEKKFSPVLFLIFYQFSNQDPSLSSKIFEHQWEKLMCWVSRLFRNNFTTWDICFTTSIVPIFQNEYPKTYFLY